MKPLLLVTLFYLTPALAAPFPGFEVAPADEPNASGYTWREAVDACRSRGMALPSQEQMATIFCHAGPDEETLSPRFPQTDAACAAAGVSARFGGFDAEGRYWTASRYHDSIMRYVDFNDGEIGYQGKDERLNVRCIRPTDTAPANAGTESTPYDINDMDQAAFDTIVDTITGIYQPMLMAKGSGLRITKRWEDEAESANSWFMEEYLRGADRIREVREIELIGGLARHPMLDRDAYAMVVCHEVGHHLGGAPRALGYSAEGQADYFAAAKCMKRYLQKAPPPSTPGGRLPSRLEAQCISAYQDAKERAICRRNIRAALTLSRWFADTRDTAPTRLSVRDRSIRRTTLVHGYPSPQCRLDTMVAGALCPVDPDAMFADDDPRPGACTRAAGYDREARPRCWFNMETPRSASAAPPPWLAREP